MNSLKEIKKWAENIAGEWNGDESGSQEDRAHCALEIKQKVAELEELLDEMDKLL